MTDTPTFLMETKKDEIQSWVDSIVMPIFEKVLKEAHNVKRSKN